MNQKATFVYTYSAKENKEVQEIRRKYLPHEESKLKELKRLDGTVQTSGMPEALSAGIGGALMFGFGLCLAIQVIGNGIFLIVFGVLLVGIGVGGMLAAYPLYRKIFNETKRKFTPRILELSAELADGKG